MCNNLHKNSTPIPWSGTGWKLFRQGRNGIFLSWMSSFNYRSPKKDWIPWITSIIGDGFCFFLTKEDCPTPYLELIKGTDVVLRKIKYRKGLGTHIDKSFNGGDTRIALCAEFKIIETE